MGLFDSLRNIFSNDKAERRRKAEAERDRLLDEGLIEAVLLLPAEFGGPADEPRNVVYLPKEAVSLKRDFDGEVVDRVKQGVKLQFQAIPEYDNDSFVPAKLMLKATAESENDSFESTLDLTPYRTWETGRS